MCSKFFSRYSLKTKQPIAMASGGCCALAQIPCFRDPLVDVNPPLRKPYSSTPADLFTNVITSNVRYYRYIDYRDIIVNIVIMI